MSLIHTCTYIHTYTLGRAAAMRRSYGGDMAVAMRSCTAAIRRRYGGDTAEIRRPYGDDTAAVRRRYGGDAAGTCTLILEDS